jgi:hypothetical protein
MNADEKTGASTHKPPGHDVPPEWLKAVWAQVESLKFGTVQVTVHDSKVVQIERSEKTRLDRSH